MAKGGLLRHRDFRLLWGGETVSELGSQVSLLAIPLLAVRTLQATPIEMGFLTAASTAARNPSRCHSPMPPSSARLEFGGAARPHEGYGRPARPRTDRDVAGRDLHRRRAASWGYAVPTSVDAFDVRVGMYANPQATAHALRIDRRRWELTRAAVDPGLAPVKPSIVPTRASH